MRILAVCSGGGHWVQMLRVLPAFGGAEVSFVTVDEGYRAQVPDSPFFVVHDATRWNKLKLIVLGVRLSAIILKVLPDVVVSTGAAPGYLAIRIAKAFGCRTIWIDSIANVEELSLSGQRIGKYADLWLTQWEHLAKPDGPRYAGAVI